jgi:hypothetical protein
VVLMVPVCPESGFLGRAARAAHRYAALSASCDMDTASTL